MTRAVAFILLMLALAGQAHSRQRAWGYCQQGGKVVVTNSVSSTTQVQQSYPQCTITVYATGTLNLSTLYSDNSGTPQANPFTADSTGYWFFYADNGRYDVRASGGGIPTPFTWGDISLADPASGFGTDWISQVSNKPFFDVRTYNFGAQTPGNSLTGGVLATINLAPCPLGLNGTDSNHWVVLSGGAGPTEPFLITGGTCVAGANGSIQGTPISNHSGAWTVSSNGGGVPEALQAAATAGGGVVLLQPTTYSIYAHWVVQSNITLLGSGGSSVIQVATNQWPASGTAPWLQLGGGTIPVGLTSAAAATNVHFRHFTFDGNGTNQAQQTYGTDVALEGTTYSSIEDVSVIHSWHRGQMFGLHESTGKVNRVINARAIGDGTAITGCTTINSGPGGIFVQGTDTEVSHSYVTGTCDEGYITNGPNSSNVKFISNDFISGFASAVNAPTAYHVEDASHSSLIGNSCRGFTGACYNVAPTGVSGSNITDVTIQGNLCGVAAPGQYPATCINVASDGSGHTSSLVAIGGNSIDLGGVGAYGILANGTYLTIKNNAITGAATGGIAFTAAVSNVEATFNVLKSNGTNILNANNCTTCTLTPNVTDDSTNQTADSWLITNPFLDQLISIGKATGTAFGSISGNQANGTLRVASNVDPNNCTTLRDGAKPGYCMDLSAASDAWVVGRRSIAGVSLTVIQANATGVGIMSVAAADLGSAPATTVSGFMKYCKDCTTAAICTGGGSGHMAVSNGTNWTCQ